MHSHTSQDSTTTVLAALNIKPAPNIPALTEQQLEEKLLADVIAHAKKNFVGGYRIGRALLAKIDKDEILKNKMRPETLLFSNFPQFKDEYFPTYDANRIAGTSFIASAGPSCSTVTNFMKSTVANESLDIKEIVALGACLATGTSEHSCFYDYCSGVETTAAYSGKNYDINVAAKRLSGSIISNPDDSQRLPSAFIESELTLTLRNAGKQTVTKKINTTIYQLQDGWPIYFTDIYDGFDCNQSIEQRKEVIWKIFQKSLTGLVLIHCTAGVGRTGHLILTLEILKYYNEIFASKNPETIAADIHKILDRIRENRPSLVASESQFIGAIHNANTLYHYALEKNYIKAGLPVFQVACVKKEEENISRENVQRLTF